MAKKSIPYLALFVIIIFSLIFQVLPLLNNNIYFTVDQGKTVMFVREILQNYRLFIKGPETSIAGVHAGSLWYYFETIGYGIFGGHPIGGILVLTALKLSVIIGFTLWIRTKVGLHWALTILFSFQFFWPAYEASLWSFNPFPLVPLAIIIVLLSTKFLSGAKKFYYYSLVIVLFSLNSDLAGAACFILFFIAVGAVGYRKKLIPLKNYLLTALIVPFIAVLVILKEFFELFIKTKVVSYEAAGIGVFTGTNFIYMLKEFIKILASAICPQNALVGIIIFAAILVLYFRTKKYDATVRRFILLTFGLIFISYIFFSTNRGWKDWHTVYLSPLLFITILLMLSQIKKKIAIVALMLVLVFQITYFNQRLLGYMKHSDDPSLMYNEISVIDWVYQNSETQGFSAYNYTDRYLDYPYQYLFWWYGLKKYGYLPCEYANFPLSAKELYVFGSENYLEPKRGCDRVSFLIIQSTTNGNKNSDWIEKFRLYHNLIETTKVGKITVEKYYRKIGAPDDFCIWRNRC